MSDVATLAPEPTDKRTREWKEWDTARRSLDAPPEAPPAPVALPAAPALGPVPFDEFCLKWFVGHSDAVVSVVRQNDIGDASGGIAGLLIKCYRVYRLAYTLARQDPSLADLL
jgi:hypothetical protein